MAGKVKDHLGKVYKSEEELCRAYRIPLSIYKKRISEGIKKKDALTTPYESTASSCKDHLGNIFVSAAEMCRFYNVNYYTYYARIKYGWSIEKALTYVPDVTDHKGNHYPTTTLMCRHYGISEDTYIYRIKIGWNQKKALETPVRHCTISNQPIKLNRKNKKLKGAYVEDHLGNVFRSRQAMCRYYNISDKTVEKRLTKSHWSLKEALTTPVRENKRAAVIDDIGKDIVIEDHLGNRFISVKEMCAFYKIKEATYFYRLEAGYTQAEALTETNIHGRKLQKESVDHLGNVYPSIKAMCQAYGINTSIYLSRIKRGYSLKDALTLKKEKEFTDHKGKKYPTLVAMCKQYHIKVNTYYARIKLGWSLKDALTKPCRTQCKDHEGKVYTDLNEMCAHYNITPEIFEKRRANKYSLKASLLGRTRNRNSNK